jgi:methyltransferase
MTASLFLYGGVLLATAAERVVELRVSNRNAAWSLRNGGVEHGRGHYPAMVLLHTGFLFSCLAEAVFFSRSFTPAVGLPLVAAAVLLQALRWWCIRTLGDRWNTRVIVVPGLPRVDFGPYRFLRHPNYAVVVLEGLVLPLIHNCWGTALVFSLLNAGLLRARIRVENRALDDMERAGSAGSPGRRLGVD